MEYLKSNEEIKEEILKRIRRETPTNNKYGGQSCGLPSNKVILISDELNLRIEIGYNRSQIKNYEDAMLLMELYIDEVMGRLYSKK